MKVFCVHCLKDEEYVTKKVIAEDVFNGVKVKYIKTLAYCVDCGQEVYVEDLAENNIVAYQDAYCQKMGLIKLSSIRHIPIIYNIGIRPLSKVLGFGEITYTRYYEGYIPSKIYSDKLMKIEHDPKLFLKTLESARGKISERAYRNAKSAAQSLIKQSKQKERNIAAHFSVYESSTDVAVERMVSNKANFEMSYYEPYSNAA